MTNNHDECNYLSQISLSLSPSLLQRIWLFLFYLIYIKNRGEIICDNDIYCISLVSIYGICFKHEQNNRKEDGVRER